jgi:hypothetical protein
MLIGTRKADRRARIVAFRWLLLVAFTAHLLFAHGCHGNDDHDLFGGSDGGARPLMPSRNRPDRTDDTQYPAALPLSRLSAAPM